MSGIPASQNSAGEMGGNRASTAAKLRLLLIPAVFIAFYYAHHALQKQPELQAYKALPWVSFWWALYAGAALHIVVTALAGNLWLKIPVEKIAFGMGPRLFEVNIAGIPVCFKTPMPGGYAKFAETHPPLSYGWRGVIVSLSGCAVLLMPIVATGGMRVFPEILTFWQDFWYGTLHPADYAQVLLSLLNAQVHVLSATQLLIVVFFGAAAINLMPIPLLNGGNALMCFVPERWHEALFRVGIIVWIVACLAWLWALARFAMTP
jgi:hypothetical protein